MTIDNKKVFVDTAPFIYFIEGDSKNAIIARDMFFNMINHHVEIITSQISDLEFKVLPKRYNQQKKIYAFDSFINEFDIKEYYITNKTYEFALEIRVNYPSIKLIDAFQIAIALEQNCDFFITNDKQLLKFNGIKCRLFEDFS